MDNKYRKLKKIFLIICFIQFNVLVAQTKKNLVFNKIQKESFIISSPENNMSISSYNCIKCAFGIEYISQNNYFYSDYFVINGKKFEIEEQLNQQGIFFYDVFYLNQRYLFISAIDVNVLGKGSSNYKDYYLFILDKKNEVLSFRQLIRSKMNKNSAFLFLKKTKKSRTINKLLVN